MKSVMMTLLLIPAAIHAVAQAVEDTRGAAELLAEASTVYSTCSSYRDRGAVENVFRTSGGERAVRKPFTTAFVRPDRFRFEFRSRAGSPVKRPDHFQRPFQNRPAEEKWNRYIVFADGPDVKSWRDARSEISEVDSLSRAITGATGVSGGSSHTIPALLMPDDIGGFKLTDLEDLERLEDARLGASECYVLRGRHPRGHPYTIWLDKKSLLIRQLFTTSELSGSSVPTTVETTTFYEPEIDVEIHEEELQLGAPVASE